MKPKSLFGLIAMIGFGAMLLLNFGAQVGGYMDFETAEASGSQAHVVGMWVADETMAYDRERNIFSFTMQDETGNVRRVEYRNPKPANFEDAERLVIEGRPRGDVFEATHILVKCPSKYNDERALQEMQQTAH